MAARFAGFQLRAAGVLGGAGSGAGPASRSPRSVSSHYSGDQNVTLVSMVRQLKDMVNKCKTKLQRSCFSVLSDLYSL